MVTPVDDNLSSTQVVIKYSLTPQSGESPVFNPRSRYF
nr:MAG TPA: hypothetical protein [Caudoviricetes sp.]DAQ17216.1 MAG TPA: hypothetical protein [Caudoviricetes sp.]